MMTPEAEKEKERELRRQGSDKYCQILLNDIISFHSVLSFDYTFVRFLWMIKSVKNWLFERYFPYSCEPWPGTFKGVTSLLATSLLPPLVFETLWSLWGHPITYRGHLNYWWRHDKIMFTSAILKQNQAATSAILKENQKQ